MWITQILIPILFSVAVVVLTALYAWRTYCATLRKRTASSFESSSWGRLEHLESQLKSLRLEWEDTYEKLSRLAGRVDRYRTIAKETSSTDSSASSATLTNGQSSPETRKEVLRRWHSRGRAF